MLELSINGQGMGSELRIAAGEPLVIKAGASINPDIGALSSLELIEQGEIVKTVSARSDASELELRHELSAQHGTWFVLRARGKDANVVGYSGAIYIFVDGQGFWKPRAVPAIVAKLKSKVQTLVGPRPLEKTEAWETQEVDARYWAAQQGLLKARIEQASAIYDGLASRARAAVARHWLSEPPGR